MQERAHAVVIPDDDVCFVCQSHDDDEKGKDTRNDRENFLCKEQQDETAKCSATGSDITVAETLKTSDVSTSDNTTDNSDAKPIKIVIQRFRHAKLLLHDDDNTQQYITVGSKIELNAEEEVTTVQHSQLYPGGILVYISFARSTQSSMIYPAARTVLNLPIVVRGQWGDGSKPCSVLKLASDCYLEEQSDGVSANNTSNVNDAFGVAVVIVPQANLVSKARLRINVT